MCINSHSISRFFFPLISFCSTKIPLVSHACYILLRSGAATPLPDQRAHRVCVPVCKNVWPVTFAVNRLMGLRRLFLESEDATDTMARGRGGLEARGSAAGGRLFFFFDRHGFKISAVAMDVRRKPVCWAHQSTAAATPTTTPAKPRPTGRLNHTFVWHLHKWGIYSSHGRELRTPFSTSCHWNKRPSDATKVALAARETHSFLDQCFLASDLLPTNPRL